MIFHELQPTSGLTARLREVIDPAEGALLVGGVVRDQIAGVESHDVDLIIPENVRKVARQTADSLGGKFFPLDESRGMYRVLLTNDAGIIEMVDFSRLQAETLEADLRLRDFTVNAMAVNLHNPAEFIDPFNGKQDLMDGILRLCSEDSLENDPVRVIRAARMALNFHLRLAPGLLSNLRKSAHKIQRVSAERQRDELFKILDGRHITGAIRIMDSFGVLELILPGVANLKGIQQSLPHTMDVYEHTLAAIDRLNGLLDLFLNPRHEQDDGGNLTFALAAGKLGEYIENLREHYQSSYNLFRSRRSLVKFSALLHDIGKPGSRAVEADGRVRFLEHEKRGTEMAGEICRHFALSDTETEAVTRFVAHHMRPRNFPKDDHAPTRRSVYRFYKDAKEVGVDICLFSLADYLALTAYPPKQEDWITKLDRTKVFFEGWFSQKESWIQPQRLIRGEDIMRIFELQPGRIVGIVLTSIEEAQAAGEVSTREEALSFARTVIETQLRENNE